MKKFLIVAASILTASSAYAAGAAVCTGAASAGNGTAIDGTVGFTSSQTPAGTGFVINSFTPKCSANVHAAVEQDEIKLAVAAGSKKGKNLFSGSTNGGSVAASSTSYANGVSASDVTGATTTAMTAGSS